MDDTAAPTTRPQEYSTKAERIRIAAAKLEAIPNPDFSELDALIDEMTEEAKSVFAEMDKLIEDGK